MTIASEITRIQWAKADIKTAIEAKGVSIPSSDTIDCYACCIDSISTWSNVKFIDLLVVWWGWNWWWDTSYIWAWWWWGWWWWVIYKNNFVLSDNSYSIVVWNAWQNSCFWNCIAYAWWNWGWPAKYWYAYAFWCPWWNWWGWWWTSCWSNYSTRWWVSCPLQWTTWMPGSWNNWWGWWWATPCNDASCMANRYDWKDWFYTDISWTGRWYAWWGGWWTYSAKQATSKWWCWWWWCWMRCSSCWASDKNATYYWGWWWGGTRWNAWGNWFQWIVIVRYKTDWSYWIDPNCAFWWCKYTCWDYTIHCYDAVWKYFFSTNWCEIKEPWIYHNQSCWLITLSTDWVNWTTIKDKNIWATSTNLNNCSSYWCTFAWGNNYWFCGNESNENSQIDASTYWPNNYYCCNKWRCWYLDWSSVRNTNLWWYDTWTKEAMRWPSAEWFHVPTCTEFINLSCALKCINGWNISANAFKEYLFMPTTQWYSRHNCTVTRAYIGTDWWYWTSTPRTSTWYECNAFYARLICIDAWCNLIWNWGRAVWYSIREFKNTPEIPTIDWWDKLL